MDSVDRCTERLIIAVSVLKTLEESINIFSQLEKDHFLYEEMRDSVIKRFEYSTDTFCKFLIIYLDEKHGIIVPMSPKRVFKAAVDAHVISPAEEEELRLLIENRNLISHEYYMEHAKSVSAVIPLHYQVLKTVMNRLSSE